MIGKSIVGPTEPVNRVPETSQEAGRMASHAIRAVIQSEEDARTPSSWCRLNAERARLVHLLTGDFCGMSGRVPREDQPGQFSVLKQARAMLVHAARRVTGDQLASISF